MYGGIDGDTLIWADLAEATVANPAPTYTADVKDQTVITSRIECDGCTGDYPGTFAADPAQRFYTPSRSIEGQIEGEAFIRGEIIKISSVANCGYSLEYWKVGGDCIVYKAKWFHYPEYPYRDHMDDLQLAVPVGGNRYEENEIYIEPLGGNIEINAVFTCSTGASLEQIRFTSDHGVLHDGLENGVEVLDVTGADCPDIEWLASGNR